MINQCAGCQQNAPINENGNHTDKDGRAFMGCQKARYQDGWWESATCLACGAKARSANELPCGH